MNQAKEKFNAEVLRALRQRLVKNLKHRRKWASRNKYEAFRIFEIDIPELAFIADFYNDAVVVYDQFLDDLDEATLKPLITTICEALDLPPERLYYKRRRRQKGHEQYQKLSSAKHEKVIWEGSLKFKVNFSDYLDTGLFLDHRPLRQWLSKESWSSKKVLNLFSYTGSLSVATASQGAEVFSIDLSRAYLQWSQENFEINGLNPASHKFIQEDIVKWVKFAERNRYDLIILDPPTFSNSKSMSQHLDIQLHHAELLMHLAPLLKADGLLIFSGNKKRFKLDDVVESFFPNILDISLRTIPSDVRNQKAHFCFLMTKEPRDLKHIAGQIAAFR